MDECFKLALKCAVRAFRELECTVPVPALAAAQGGYAFRYKEKSLEQALVQKAARLVTGLEALRILLRQGLLQEMAVIQRTLDELGEDIVFLCLPLHGEPKTDLHERYLNAFYDEEINESGNLITSPQRRDMVPRRKIRAAIANSLASPLNPSDHIEIHRTIDKVYSGFVHASSPQVMDMCVGNPPRFQVEGMLKTQRMPAAERDAWNYFYRSLAHLALIAMCFGLGTEAEEIQGVRARMENHIGWKPLPGHGNLTNVRRA